ncbi:conserved Plasmodium protein, unknown function [Plasmodium malariae]|uniref:Uncharacterized protein n=1 Tax=Plasmodium malariae TaxID=5858 RepID=A0A1C3L076_PLAMA|nr:conserved Plasmodium protein, unknown function [Plasmodium malariae]
MYVFIVYQTDLENNYYQIEEKPRNLSGNFIKENEEYIYLNDSAYYKLKINKEEKDEDGENDGIEKMKIKYTLDENNKSSVIENVLEPDSMLMHICNMFFSLKDCIKSVFLFLSKIFHFNFLDYTYLKNYSLTNYFDRNVKDYMKYLKKTEDSRLVNQDFLLRKRYVAPYFVYNCVDCNYNTNDNGIIILSSILPFIHSFDYDYKLKHIRMKEDELDNILNNEKSKNVGGFIEYLRKMKTFFFGRLYEENNTSSNNSEKGNCNNSEYSEFLKKFENSINEEGELIQDILFSGKAQMIFINFKQLENNFNNVIGNIEIKNDRVQVSNLILGYEKREHIKYTDILISNILKNIKKKYPDIVIKDENPQQSLYEENEYSEKILGENSNEYNISNKEDTSTISDSVDINRKELYKLSDLKEYVYNSPSHLMKEKKNNCEYVTCVCFDNNSNNCNLINNFVLGYNTGKIEYIYGKILYSNISHCDLLIDYYSKKNKKFSYELSKRIFLNGSVIKICFAPNGFFCLILTSKTLYICNFFYFSIYEVTNTCYNSQFVNFLWINNNCYSVFNDNGNVYLYEKNLKNNGLNSFSLVRSFFIDQNIYFNSICEYHLYSNCIYLYTGEIEMKRRKSASHLFKKKKKKLNKQINDCFYKYDCNFIIIDLNSDIHKIIANNRNSDLIGGLLKDNVTDLENNMKQIKILEKLIENGNNFEEDDLNFENMLHINIKDFNNYISTIKDVNNNLYISESGDERNNMIEYDNTREEFSVKRFVVNYLKDVKKHLYNLKNENVINILLPRYYSCADDYSHKNFLNIRFFTIEKSDNKHLIALDTETDYVYIYKIRKNVYLDDDTLDLLKNNPYSMNNNALKMFYSSYMKKESILKDEWKIYNEYIYVNTKKLKKYIKYNLLYIIKNHKKVFFPLHVYVINTKLNDTEYFLFIKWATIKNSFIYSSYNSLNRVTKMKDYFKFYTSPIGNINPNASVSNMPYNYKGFNKFSENDFYNNDYYMNSNNKDSTFLSDNKKQNASEKKWSYLKKLNIFNKKDDIINDNYGNSRHLYSTTEPEHLKNKHSHMFNNLENESVLSDMKNSNFYVSPNHLRYNRLHYPTDSSKLMDDENTNFNVFYSTHNDENRYNANNISANSYDPYILKNDLYNYRNINNLDLNINNDNAYMHNDLYRTNNELNNFPGDIHNKVHTKIGNFYSNRDVNDVNQIYEEDEYRNSFKSFNRNDSYLSNMRKYM